MATRIETTSSTPLTVLRELALFLARPRVLTPMGLRLREAWTRLGVMTALHLGGMLLVILPLLGWWQKTFALPLPDAFGKMPPSWLLPVTLAAAPLLEEIIFRGWQTGRPRALWLLACFVAFVALAMGAQKLQPPVLAGALFALVVAALGGWWWLRKRQEPPALYLTAYPAIFWAVALVFAGVHLMNYPTASLLSLPMVMPQLWAALLLGFTRQRIGLPAAMLQHATANAAAMALVQLGG